MAWIMHAVTAGGAFMVYYDAENDELTTFDAREKAPMNATEERFILPNGTTMEFLDAWQSGISVGVPGVPMLLEMVHTRYGSVKWNQLFEKAIALALNGYNMSQRMYDQAEELLAYNPSCDDRTFFRDNVTFNLFINDDCIPKAVGTTLLNPEYAAALEVFAAEGAVAFYTGDLAQAIVDKVAADRNPTGDATITMEDMAAYEVVERKPVCANYRDTYDVCGMGPPSSGGLAVGQIVGILNSFNLTEYEDPLAVDTVHLFTQAMRLAFADRNQYVGDADFIPVPADGMLDAEYLAERAAMINMTTDMGTALPGTPPGTYDTISPQEADPGSGTSHIVIVDQYGNALSMTTTVESYYGSGLMTNGFLLNNQLTDFSFEPADGTGTPIANRVQPSKRPRSSMAPTIVLDAATGKPAYLVGSPGGSRIIGYVAQTIISMIDFSSDPQVAINEPRYQNRNDVTELEVPMEGVTFDYDMEALAKALRTMNHTVANMTGEVSGLSAIAVEDDGDELIGAADPRRDGKATGRVTLDSSGPTLPPSPDGSGKDTTVPASPPSGKSYGGAWSMVWSCGAVVLAGLAGALF